MNKLGQHDLQQQQDLGEVDSTPTLSCLSYLASKAGASSIAERILAPVSVVSCLLRGVSSLISRIGRFLGGRKLSY